MAAPDAERPINALTASQNVLDCFWNLAAPEEEKRLSSAQSLVKELLARQEEHSQAHPASADSNGTPAANAAAKIPKAKQQELALRRCCPLMVYALRRLARGLGSGRAGARQGFATALALLLGAQVEGSSEDGGTPVQLFVDGSDVLVLLDTCLEASGTMKASDAREALVGRLFGYGALVQSGLLTRSQASPSIDVKTPSGKAGAKGGKGAKAAAAAPGAGVSPADLAACAGCVKALLELGRSRSFLMEAATATLLQLIGRLGPTGAAQLLEQSSELRDAVCVQPAEASPEALLLALSLWPVMSPQLLATCPLLPKGCPAPAAAVFFPPASQPKQGKSALQQQQQGGPFDFLGQQQPGYEAPSAACCDALFSTTYLQAVLPALQGTITSNPRLHLLWRTLLALLLPGFRTPAAHSPSPAPTPTLLHVEALWSTVVESGLLTGSHEKRFLAFRLFQALLPHLGPEHVPVVFSKGFSKVLLNNLRNKDNYLHAAATRCMDVVLSFADGAGATGGGAANGATRLAVAAVLQQLNVRGADGTAAGAAAAKAKAKKALPSLDTAGISAYLEHNRAAFAAAGEAAAADGQVQPELAAQVDSQRAHAVEQLCSVLRFPAIAPEDVERVLRFLATHAFIDAPVAAAAAAGAGGGAASAKKGKKGGAAVKAPAAAAVAEPEVAEAAAMSARLSPHTRQLCAQRLIGLLGMLAPHKQRDPKQQGQDGKAEQGQDGGQRARLDGPAVMGRLVAYLQGFAQDSSTSSTGASSCLVEPLEGERDVALTMLREVEQALVALAAGMGSKGGLAPERAPAQRTLLHLVRMLQVCVLADPKQGDGDEEGSRARGNVDPELALGLRRVAREGLGAPLEELATQDTDAAVGGEDEEGEGSEDKEEEEAGQAPWQDVLVDVLLSLLSRPASSAPTAGLRDAVEALWRSLASSLTPSGMADLVRVVVGGGEAGDVLEGEDEEEEEEVELEVGSDSDDESEEEEEEEEEEEAGKAKAKTKAKSKGGDSDDEEEEDDEDDEEAGKSKAKAGKAGSDDDDEESGDDDEPDDAEMFAMDERMAAYLRRMVDARNSAKERRQALSNLRLRALVLIQTHANKVPHSPLMLMAALPLTKALITARRALTNNARPTDLVLRLEAVLRSMHSPGRPAPPSALPFGADELTAALRAALGTASRERDRVAAQAAANCWSALVKAAATATAPEGAAGAAVESYRAALACALAKKSRLHLAALEEVAKAAPAAALPSLPDLLRLCSSAAKPLQQAEALQLLAHLFKPALSLQERRTARQRKLDKLKAAQEQQQQQQKGGKAKSGKAMAAAGAEAEKEEGLGADNEALAASLSKERQPLGAALVCAVAGAGMKRHYHVLALKSAATVVEGLRVLFPNKRLPEVIGPDTITSMAKAVATVQDMGAAPKVGAQIKRLVSAASLDDLLTKTKADPALKAKLAKAQQKARPQQAGEPDGQEGAKAGKPAGKGKAGQGGDAQAGKAPGGKPGAKDGADQGKKRPAQAQEAQPGSGKKVKAAGQAQEANGNGTPKKRPAEVQQAQKKKPKVA